MWEFLIFTFFEALILPIPTEPFFVLLVLAKKHRVALITLVTVIASTLGAVLGYCIGLLFSDFFVNHILMSPRFHHGFEFAVARIETFAFLAVFLAALAPIPFTPVIFAAGLLRVNFGTFMLASVLGRALRYGAVASLVIFFGPEVIDRIRKNIMPFIVGLFVLVLATAIVLFMEHRR